MAYVKSITVRGLNDLEEFSARLDDRATVFHGLNGLAKKTLMKLVYSCLQGDSSVLKHEKFNSAAIEISTEGKLYNFTIERKECLDHRPRRAALDFPPAWRVESGSATIEDFEDFFANFAYLPSSRVYLIPYYKKLDSSSILEPSEETREEFLQSCGAESLIGLWKKCDLEFLLERNSVLGEGLLRIIDTIYSGKDRKVEPKAGKWIDGAHERMKMFLNLHDIGDDFISIRTFKKMLEGNPRLMRIAVHASETVGLMDLLKGPADKLEDIFNKLLGKGRKVSFTNTEIIVTSKDDEKIPLSDLSLGELSTMLLLVGVISVGDGIFLVEYIETSIHAKFLAGLLKTMRALNPKAQIIVTTHSRVILDHLEEGKALEVIYSDL